MPNISPALSTTTPGIDFSKGVGFYQRQDEPLTCLLLFSRKKYRNSLVKGTQMGLIKCLKWYKGGHIRKTHKHYFFKNKVSFKIII